MVQDTSLTSSWRSPSNIAIIKYWGKHDDQLPDNPSVSITLTEAYTETQITAHPLVGSEESSLTFLFEGKEQPVFADRVRKYINKIQAEVPFVNQHRLRVSTRNSFPHSAGIASSASAMSAIALCISDIQARVDGKSSEDFYQRVSWLSRLASGSACRSVFGPASLWGKTSEVKDSSDEYAIPINVHPLFQNLRDTILIVDDHAKAVSSSEGHALMKSHPFGSARVAQAHQHLKLLLPALQSGDITTFGRIAEAEALTLHALMMTSDPAYLLMQPNTLRILESVQSFRSSSGLSVYFTLDAGPNVHVLYPKSEENDVRSWIRDQLSVVCKGGRMIHDHAGRGPVKIGETGEAG